MGRYFHDTILLLSSLILWSASTELSAQTLPVLEIETVGANPRLLVTGQTGVVHVIECSEHLGADSVWRTLSYCTMSNSVWIWQDQTIYGSAARFYQVVAVTNSLPPNPDPDRLVWIPPGTFTMGAPTNEVTSDLMPDYREWPQTVVTLTRDFFIEKYPVTQADYLSLMNTNPSYYTTNKGYSEDLSRPVDQVSWYDATNYCWQLNQREQLAGRLPAGWAYRLPTEAEWEYACRAGTITPFSCGNDLRSGMADFNGQQEYVGAIGTVYNPNGYFNPVKTSVGSYPPNPWGLYDMIGNTQNWCLDPWCYFPGGRVVDWVGTPLPGYSDDDAHAARGATSGSPGFMCRSAFRNNMPATDTNVARGIRVVLARTTPGD